MTSSPQGPGKNEPEGQPSEEASQTPPVSQEEPASTTPEAREGAGQPEAAQSEPDQAESAQAESAQAESAPSESAPEEAQPEEADDAPAGKRKLKIGLTVGIAVVAVAAASVGFVVFGGSGSAQSAAEEYAAVSMQETHDPRSVTAEDYRPVVCGQVMPQIEELQMQKEEFLKMAKPEELEQLKQVQVTVKSVQENGDTGSATVESTFPGQPPQTSDLKLVKENGDWKLCA